MLDFYAYDWVKDPREDETNIRIYGLDEYNQNVCVRIDNFQPFMYVDLPKKSYAPRVIEEIEQWLVNCEVVERTHLYSNQKSKHFLFCLCETKADIMKIVWKLEKGIKFNGQIVSLTSHEHNASEILQLASLRQIPMAGWVTVSDYTIPAEKITSCPVEVVARWKFLSKSTCTKHVTPKIISYDLEVNSEVCNSMPDDRPDDVIFQISCVTNSEPRRKVLFTLPAKDLDEINEGIEVRVCPSEKDLICEFCDYISEEAPNALAGYNILTFDMPYQMKRAKRFRLMDELKGIGFNKRDLAEEKTIKWNSSAFKNQEYNFIACEGIVLLDLLPIVKRDYKMDNYKMDTIANFFLGLGKDPVTPKDIFQGYRDKRLARIGNYCVRDSEIPLDLIEVMHVWDALAEPATIMNVTMFSLYTQGQQLKTFSQIYKHCLHNNIVVTTKGYTPKADERLQGAYVFDPIPGVYENIVPLDFASLYPSIMIAHNICYSTLADETVPDELCNIFEWEDHCCCQHDPKVIKIQELTDKIDAIEQEIKKLRDERDTTKGILEKKRIQKIMDEKKTSQKPYRDERKDLKTGLVVNREDESGQKISRKMCVKRRYKFYKAEVKKGVVPTILESLLSYRQEIKKKMRDETDEKQKIIYDQQQKGCKVSANSAYGGMGVTRGYLGMMPCAMTITYVGRRSVKLAAETATTKWGAKVIYGDTDSNYMYFPGKTGSKEIWDYAEKVATDISSLFPKPMALEFENVIYHKFLILHKKKYMYQSMDRDGNIAAKVGKRGVILARRDNSLFLRGIYEKLAEKIFAKDTKQQIEDFLLETINSLMQNQIPYDQFVATISVGDFSGDLKDNNRLGNYKVRKQLPTDPAEREKLLNGRTERDFYLENCPRQVTLANKMSKRGVPVDTGSRLEYVIIKNPLAKKLGEQMEDFDYFKKRTRTLSIDKLYYLKTLVNPLDQLLTVVNMPKFMETQYKLREKFHEKVLGQLFVTPTLKFGVSLKKKSTE